VWFTGLQAIRRVRTIETVYDLSATPFYLSGSGYYEGYIFPWVVSDFSLMDAIESGIVKIPRIPVDDDATGDLITYLQLWEHVGKKLPKRSAKSWRVEQVPELEGAIDSLYHSYCRSFEHWERALKPHGEPPPVYIVVCPNTVVSRLVYEHIAGVEPNEGALPHFSNVVDGHALARPRTVLIDSAQLESGEVMKADFKKAAAAEIESFKADYRRLNPGADADKLTDEDLLREVMNTVGKNGKLGEGVRCVVSVAMLTEGWDANTVTHILGIRAFNSQLLCEQVVGRGLRRRSYALNEDGRFEAEYTNVYGVPFAFIPSDRVIKEVLPREPPHTVESVPGREHLRIRFPKLDGYRVEIPDEPLVFDPNDAERLVIGPGTVPTRVSLEGITGESEEVVDRPEEFREQRVAYELAKMVLNTRLTPLGEDPLPWRFPQLVHICRSWLKSNVDVASDFSLGHMMGSTQRQEEAADAVYNAITRHVGNRRERLRPMIRPFDPVGSTANVRFSTRKAVEETEKSEISHVTLDGIGGNTWEQLLANACERDRRVHSYAKNDHLGFEIPYVHQGVSHAYVPDFLVRLVERPDDVPRTLIVEVSGGQKSPGPTKAKAATARDRWCVAVNNHGGFGRWGYTEITSMKAVRKQLAEAIDLLYADAPIAGDPDRLDYDEGDDRAAS
jgi:type III restriction enzyme